MSETKRLAVLLPKGKNLPNHKAMMEGRNSNIVYLNHTDHFNIFYDGRLGSVGRNVADGVLESCEKDYNLILDYFNNIKPSEPFNIIIGALETGGAYHDGCTSGDIYCDIRTTPLDINYTRFLCNPLTVSTRAPISLSRSSSLW
jgi:hypothetical protein